MKLLLTTDTVGGVWDYTAALAAALDASGHCVLLAVLGEPDAARLAQVPPSVEVVAHPFRLEWMPDAAADVAAAGSWLASLARGLRADVVHLNQMAYGTQPFGAPMLVVVHSDVFSWFGETLGAAPAGAEWARYAARVKAGLAGAHAVVAPSAYQARLTLRHYGRAVDRVIHNGVAAPAERPAPRAEALVVSAARAWDAAKGVDVLDAALARLGAAAPPAHLLGELASPAGEGFQPRRLVAHGKLGRPETDAWLARASLYVAPSRYEPFGLAPLEAALRGCALVLSDLGSFRELWDGCAAFFPVGDADALAALLGGLAADAPRRAALARAAQARAAERYTVERMTDSYLALYRELAGHGSRPVVLPPPSATTPAQSSPRVPRPATS